MPCVLHFKHMKIILAFLASGLTFTALDYIWLGQIMKGFYLEKLASHIEVKDGSLVVNLPAAIVFYVLALFSVYYFVIRNVGDIKSAAISGAILGLLMYAFYDFTNLATLKDWSLGLSIVDTLWGGVLMSVVSVVMFYVLS